MASKLLRRSGVAVGLIADLLKWRADWVIQVGVGYHYQEVDVLKGEWSGVKFVGIEPLPDYNEPYPGELIHTAVGREPGRALLNVKKCHKDGSSLRSLRGMNDLKRVKVPVATLDGLFPKGHEGRVLLWLDCEGSELDALRGGKKYLECVEVANIEMTANPPSDDPDWCDPDEVHWWMVQAGFLRQWIHTQRTNEGQYDSIYVRPHLFKPQYCCDPWERTRFGERETVE
jgi:FkbM family methyltransferase